MPGIWFYGLRCHLFRGFLDTDMCVYPTMHAWQQKYMQKDDDDDDGF